MNIKTKTFNLFSLFLNSRVLYTLLLFMSSFLFLSILLIIEYKLQSTIYTYSVLFIFVFLYTMLIISILNIFYSQTFVYKYISTSSILERLLISYIISYIALKLFLFSSNIIITNDILLTMASNPGSGTNTTDPVRF